MKKLQALDLIKININNQVLHTMNRVVDLSIETPIDVAKAIVLLGNQTKIFNQMLGKLEVLSLNPSLEALA